MKHESEHNMDLASFTQQDAASVAKLLETSLELGLLPLQVKERQKRYGLNQTHNKNPSFILLFFHHRTYLLIYLFILAGLTTFFFYNYPLAYFILAILCISLGIDLYQQYRAIQTTHLLQNYLKTASRVLRQGSINSIPTNELVPGDIIILEAGDYIPADIRFIQAYNITVNESSITGTETPIKKTAPPLSSPPTDLYTAHNIGFSGTYLLAGKGRGIIIATGSAAAFTTTSTFDSHRDTPSTLQQTISHMVNFIIILIIATSSTLLIATCLTKGISQAIPMLLFCIALSLNTAPEIIFIITTMILMHATVLLSNRNMIVKRLSALEDLGELDVLCSDKTGTLTENAIALDDVYTLHGEDPVFYALLGSQQEHSKALDPFDQTLWKSLTSQQISDLQRYRLVDELPFDHNRLRTTVLVDKGSQAIISSRGVYSSVITHCKPLPQATLSILEQWLADHENQGHRAIAIASRELPQTGIPSTTQSLETEEHDLIFIGFIAFKDPIKTTVTSTIKKAHSLGISIKILTGDSKEVARSLGYRVGLITNSDQTIDGATFAALNSQEKLSAVENITIFGRVTPEQKCEIVGLLKLRHTVGYLGDGFNDASALHTADVGVAVHDALDVAKDASDIILLKKSLASIIEGVELGRTILQNIIIFIKTSLSSGIGHFFSLALTSLFFPSPPLLPLQIVVAHLLTTLPSVTFALTACENFTAQKPSHNTMRTIIATILLFAGITMVYDGIFLSIFYKISPSSLQSMWFIQIVMSSLALLTSLIPRHCLAHKAYLSVALLTIIITFIMPFTNRGQTTLGLVEPQKQHLIILLLLICIYLTTNKIVKSLLHIFSIPFHIKSS
jgi:P-type Mg2+ transporter